MELELAKAYDALGRPDLGDCVRGGKKYQRLGFAVEYTNWEFLRQLCKLFKREMLGDRTKEGFEAAAREKYAEDPRLQLLLARANKSAGL